MTIAIDKRPVYVTPSGWKVYDLSHSQWSEYKECGERFKLKRVLGWREKPTPYIEFGKAGERAIRLFYQEKRDPVEVMEESWAPVNAIEDIEYPDGESWESFRVSGVGLMSALKKDWKNFPPRNPAFFDFKTNSLKIRDTATGLDYTSVPDLIDSDEQGQYIADIKFMGALLDTSLFGLVANDMQLRTQSAATNVRRAALWNFCRKPKRSEKVSPDRIFEEVRSGLGGVRYQQVPLVALFCAREANGLNIEEAGSFLGIANPKEVTKEFNGLCKEDSSLKPLAQTISSAVSALNAPRYVIQWVEAHMPKDHALEAVREEMSVIPQIQAGYFPRRGGVRFPDNICGMCKYRGLCLEDLLGPREEYTEITKKELISWDAKAMEGLD